MRAALVLATALVAAVPALPATAAHAADAPARVTTSKLVYGPYLTAAVRTGVPLSRQRVIVTAKRRSAVTGAPVVVRRTTPVAAPQPAPVATAPSRPAPAPVAPVVPASPAPATPVTPPAPAVPLPVQQPVGTVAGDPTMTARGSFVPRPCTRTYGLTGMQTGPTGDPLANGDRMRAVLRTAVPGDCITVAPALYRLAGNVEFTVPDITLRGLGQSREDVVFEHVDEMRALFMVKAGGTHFYNFTHRVRATARSSQGQSGEGNIWVQGGHSGFQMEDVLAWGSRDAAVFLYGVHDFRLNRVESRDSKSDAFHITNGSSNGVFYDSVSRNSGDDGLGFVGYDGEGASTPHHMTVVRHRVDGQTWGRGIGIVHANNITIQGPTLIERTAGAGIILAREPQYGSGAVRAVRILGELRFRSVNTNEKIDHGAITIHNPTTDAPIEDVLITGPVVMVDTGALRPGGVSNEIRASGAGRISAEIGNVTFYGTGPSTHLWTQLAPGSSLTTPGWSNASPRLGAEPAWQG